jgi:hypothetical protein
VDLNTKFKVLSNNAWSISIPNAWKVEETGDGVIVESDDEVHSIYISTYTVKPRSDDWAQKDISLVKEAKLSTSDGSFQVMEEVLGLDSDAEYFVLDAFAKENNFRIYTKHYRFMNRLVTFSIHDYWCESYKDSVKFTESIISSFGVNKPPKIKKAKPKPKKPVDNISKEFKKQRYALSDKVDKDLKALIKGTPWRIKQACLFIDIEGLFFRVRTGVNVERNESFVSIELKPMNLDPIYWGIVGLNENNKEPLSFRAWGAFTCSSLPVFMSFYSDNDIASEDLANFLFDMTKQKTAELFAQYRGIPFSTQVVNHVNQIERGAYAITLVVSLIDEAKYDEAYNLAKSFFDGTKKSSSNHIHKGKGFHELAMDWLEKSGRMTTNVS